MEANPGPKIDDVLSLVNVCHAETMELLKKIHQDVTGIETRVTVIESTLGGIAQIESNCEGMSNSVKEVKSSIARANEELGDVVEDMNNRMRRNNLLVKGLPESENESYEKTESIVKEFFSAHLSLTLGDIERAHRIGQRRSSFNRPIIIKFLNYKSKTEALRNAFKLKNLASPRVWIEEDFSPKIQQARKRLRDFAKLNRKESERYSLRFNTLHMQNGIYRYDSSCDSVVVSKERHPSQK